MPKPKFYGRHAERKLLSRRWRRQQDQEEIMSDTASSGVKTNGHGDPYVHAPGVREEQATIPSHKPSAEIPISQNTNVPKGDKRGSTSDPYGVLQK